MLLAVAGSSMSKPFFIIIILRCSPSDENLVVLAPSKDLKFSTHSINTVSLDFNSIKILFSWLRLILNN